ncbi:hypothetical protein [Novosphingobium sediminis]|nr:hypothetical protein [Novosphingobium sediminis]
MQICPHEILRTLLEAEPRQTCEAPRDARGLYGLVDHRGKLRYIGATQSVRQTLYQRIHNRHRSGSEGMSHYFSDMYNVGRMWRDRDDRINLADGKIAKKLRNAFVSDHCRAVWTVLPDTVDIMRLEDAVIAIAPEHATAWNGRKMAPYCEPVELVDATIARLRLDPRQRAAIDRQHERFMKFKTTGLIVA